MSHSRSFTFPVLAAVFGLLAGGGAAIAQQDFSQVQIQQVPVAGKITMLIGAGGNIGVSAGDDGVLVIDDQFAPLADKIRAAVRTLSTGEIVFLLNTHWHGDHTGGNAEFGKEATIVAHRNVRQRLSTRQTVRGQVSEPSPPVALPVITYEDKLSIHFNGEEIRVVHFPSGHTDGDSVVWFSGSNVVHLGDDFFAGRFPFVDLSSGGSVQGLESNISKVLEMIPADSKIIPGHGPLSTVTDLREYHAMLRETIGAVRSAKQAGRSVEDVVKAGLGAQWKSWGSGFINEASWIQTIYSSL